MSLLKSKKLHSAIILTLLFVIVCSLPFWSVIRHWDLALYDKQSNFIRDFKGVEQLQNEVVLIGIDEQTYEQIKEPFALWHKSFADLFMALSTAEASAVALDITFPSRSFNHIIPDIDQTLLKAMLQLKKQAPIVLGTTIDNNKQSREVYGPFLSVVGKKDQHLDADLFKLFLSSGIYKEYALKYLKPEQIDDVDISNYLK